MASEQSSQSHLPSAWPEAAEPSPSWSNDSLGTGPRLPLPQNEQQSGNGPSWQTSPGEGQRASTSQADLPGGGRSQSTPPQSDGRPQSPQADGWAQASAPQNNDGWAQATNPQVSSWPDAFSPRNDGWAQASAPQNNDSWAQGSGSQADGWAQASGSQADGWAQASGSQADGWAQASAPQNNDGWTQGSAAQADGWAQASGPRGTDNRHQTPPGNGNGWPQPTSPQSHNGDQRQAPQTDSPGGRPQAATPDDTWPPTPPHSDRTQNPQADSWAQATSPQAGGWAQASAPQSNDGWAQGSASQADGWAQASGSQADGWAQATTPQADGWAQASGPQGTDNRHQTPPGNGNGWPQPTSPQSHNGDQRQAPQTDSPGGRPQAATPDDTWPPTPPHSDRTQNPQADSWAQATSPQGNAQRQGSGAAGETWQATAPGQPSGRPSAENNAWPPAQAENAAWPPTSPAGGDTWPPATPGNAGFAEAPTSTFSPAWANGDAPAARSGGALPGTAQGSQPGATPFGSSSPDGGHPNGPRNGGDSGGENARRGYGVPDNPAMWALAAANAAAPNASSALGAPPVHPGTDPRQGGPQQGQSQPGQPQPGQVNQPGQPGHHLSRDPSDPNKPFVTAGQISGPKTPPPERQQELWNTVFGDNYQAIEDEEDGERGRPVWIFALAGSVVIALLGAVLWAFLAGPLASADEEIPADPKPAATQKSTKPAAIGRLPRFTGDASPVAGTLTDQQAGITLAQLGAPWRQDQRPGMPASYGFTTRQYLPAGPDSTGKTQFAQLMSGPLSPRLKAKYTSPENLAPVINAVASSGRNKFFPEGNTARKTAQQTLSVNGLPGQLAAYEITSGDSKTTMVVAAVSTGADLPAIVYMSVPDSKKELLPDINTVFKSIRALER
ncbi:hypothetical protein [Streptosporangium sp. NPDC049046]|uniref:hypothetical protein n=1 Tax=Streptosporangium sp. NPDC049046 TaxID=3155031 RepID=UPI0034304977